MQKNRLPVFPAAMEFMFPAAEIIAIPAAAGMKNKKFTL